MQIKITDKLIKIIDGDSGLSIEDTGLYLRTDDVTKVGVERLSDEGIFKLIFSNGEKRKLPIGGNVIQFIYELDGYVKESGTITEEGETSLLFISSDLFVTKLFEAQQEINLFFLARNNSSANYKIFRGQIKLQTGTNPPQLLTFENNFGGDFIATRNSIGNYLISFPYDIELDRMYYNIGQNNKGSADFNGHNEVDNISPSGLILLSLKDDGNSYSDGILRNTPIEFILYN
ncbi:MAG: hypothetical protein NTZ59_02370 [Bacteroidetes bacterium]|nr:hypothetical protein [Bacteroidota bacterium]